MRLLIYLLLGSLSSLVTNTPIFEASNDDFLDFVPSLQPVDPDNIGFNTISLNDGLENIFSTANPDLSDDTLSTDDTMAPFDGLSSDMFGLEAQTDDLFGNPGSIAFADTSLPQFPVNQDDSSYEASPADSLIMSDANVPRGPPDCAGLRPNPQVSTSTAPYQTLCCVAPCMDVQSWRDKCSGCIQIPLMAFLFIVRLLSRG